MNTEENNNLQANNSDTAQKEKALITRIQLMIEDKQWEEAEKRCDRLLEINPRSDRGCLAKLFIQNKVGSLGALLKKTEAFVDSEYWKTACESSDSELSAKLKKIDEDLIAKRKKAEAEAATEKLKQAIADSEKKRDEEGNGKLKATNSDASEFGKRLDPDAGKRKVISISCLAIAIVILAICGIYYYDNVIAPAHIYSEGCRLFNDGDYKAASECLSRNQNHPESLLKLRECREVDKKVLMEGKYSQAISYWEKSDYTNAIVMLNQIGFFNDAHLKALESLKLANGDPMVIREAEIYNEKTIAERIAEEKETQRKAIEEIEKMAAAEEAKRAAIISEAARKAALEENRREMEAKEAKRRIEEEARQKIADEAARVRDAQEEAERLAKETEKRRAAMRVELGKNKVITVNGYNIELIACPAGSFTMGSPVNELGRNADETPHQVTISQGFYIGKYEVTQGLYKAITGMNPARSFIKGDKKPVYQVSWFMADEFCDKLNKLTQKTRPAHWHFDLPTEAQWEYACRAGYPTPFNNGGSIIANSKRCPALEQAGWYAVNTPARQLSDVGMRQSNCWYICDMHGGVWEWCKDYYGNYPTGAALNPCRLDGFKKVLRGGSIRSQAKDCRSASRRGSVPGNDGNGEYDIGFRLVLVADSYEKTFQADDITGY